MKLVLEDQAFTYPHAAPHFFVVPKGEVPKSVIPAHEKNLNLRVLQYTGGFGQLKPELDQLVNDVNAARSKMQTDRSW
jgi:hypothetical protein